MIHLCKAIRQVESLMVGILVGMDQVFATPNGTYFPHDIEGSTTFLYRDIQYQGYSSQAYLNAFAYGTTPTFIDGNKSMNYYGSIYPDGKGAIGWNVFDMDYSQYFKPGVCDSMGSL